MGRSLHECRVLITGASSGIGQALAKELARHNTHLLLVARNETALAELAEELTRNGAASAVPFAADVTDAQSRKAIADWLDEHWDGLDVLVNNAGLSTHARFSESDNAASRNIMEVNFFAAVELTRQLLPRLRHGNSSRVVNVASILSHRGIPFNSDYCASKFALRGWSEAIRAELEKEGIGVTLISPGTTDTDFFEHLLTRQESSPWKKQTAISPEAVARQTVRAIQKGRREIYPNWRGRLLVWLNRLCPSLVDRIMRRYG